MRRRISRIGSRHYAIASINRSPSSCWLFLQMSCRCCANICRLQASIPATLTENLQMLQMFGGLAGGLLALTRVYPCVRVVPTSATSACLSQSHGCKQVASCRCLPNICITSADICLWHSGQLVLDGSAKRCKIQLAHQVWAIGPCGDWATPHGFCMRVQYCNYVNVNGDVTFIRAKDCHAR
jgi:hypothetical protein